MSDPALVTLCLGSLVIVIAGALLQASFGSYDMTFGQAARFADNLIALEDGEPYDWGPPEEVVRAQLLADVVRVEASVDAGSPTWPHVSAHTALPDPEG